MNLRGVLLLVLAWLAATFASAAEIEVFYLGTPDCPYCRTWEAQNRPALLASAEGRAIRLVEIRGETLRAPIEARHYPPQHRWAFDRIGPSRGVPRFLLFVNGKLVQNAYGLTAYERDFIPALKAVVVGSPTSARTPVPRRAS